MLRIRSHILYIPTDGIQLPSLFMHDMCHISEQLVQLSDTLFNIPYFRFSFDDQRFLEVDFVLRR